MQRLLKTFKPIHKLSCFVGHPVYHVSIAGIRSKDYSGVFTIQCSHKKKALKEIDEYIYVYIKLSKEKKDKFVYTNTEMYTGRAKKLD